MSPYFTLDEAARYARCSKRTIQRWLEAGRLARHGQTRPLIHRAELQAFLSPTLSDTINPAAKTIHEGSA